jgi:type II secretory ATPase GspE/PulE/Tfp pilus assembly ATPase PilB-like protein
MEKDKMDIRVSTMPTAWGESVVMRLLKSSSVGLSFDQLGLRASAYKRLKREIDKPQGMVVTTGPTGSGKTTTLYAILNTLNTPDTKIITLENPIEYRMVGIAQSQIDHSKDYTFAKGLRAILRQDPNVIMVGEIRDLETAETAVQAALTGHLLLSTIHTNDAAGAIPRFLSMGLQPFLLAPALNAIIGQRLVRKICVDCKTEMTLDLETLERVKAALQNIPENSGEPIPDVTTLKFYEGKGCTKCNKIGYKGRVGIYEIFTKNPEIEALILSGNVSEYQMKDIKHKAGMLSMGQDGLLKALEGATSVAEVLRVAVID